MPIVPLSDKTLNVLLCEERNKCHIYANITRRISPMRCSIGITKFENLIKTKQNDIKFLSDKDVCKIPHGQFRTSEMCKPTPLVTLTGQMLKTFLMSSPSILRYLHTQSSVNTIANLHVDSNLFRVSEIFFTYPFTSFNYIEHLHLTLCLQKRIV